MAARVRATEGGEGAEPATPVGREEELFDRLVHDLRNPLGVIAYFAEEVPVASAAERVEMCERLRVNARRALHVLEEFGLLGELRHGRSQPAWEICDIAEFVGELAVELETTERRPGRIRRLVEVRAPLRVPHAHLLCALRGLLREALRATAGDDVLEFSAREEGRQLLFSLTAAGGAHAGFAGANTGAELELAGRVAALYGGRCGLERRGSRVVVTLAVPASL
jgi:signal transduction histidine kinase